MTVLHLITSHVMKSSLVDHQKKLKELAHEQQVKHTSTAMEPFAPFYTLVKIVDAEEFTKRKIPILIYPWKLKI